MSLPNGLYFVNHESKTLYVEVYVNSNKRLIQFLEHKDIKGLINQIQPISILLNLNGTQNIS